MDEDKKKNIIVIVSLICLVVAVVIIFKTYFQNSAISSLRQEMVWLKCVNPKCNHEEEVNLQEYQERLEASGQNNMMLMPGVPPQVLECASCGQKSLMLAEKCQNCGTVFVPNYSSRNKFPDRCPKCGYSAIEESMKK